MLRILYLPHSGPSLRKNDEGYCAKGICGLNARQGNKGGTGK